MCAKLEECPNSHLIVYFAIKFKFKSQLLRFVSEMADFTSPMQVSFDKVL